MEHDRSNRALARIEAALGRIESAPRAAASGIAAADLAKDDLERLQTRHDQLRAAVQDSLEQLDQLIEGTPA